MNWLCFGLGFSCGIFGWFCMCFLLFRGFKESRDESQIQWENANRLAKDRNLILNLIVSAVKEGNNEQQKSF